MPPATCERHACIGLAVGLAVTRSPEVVFDIFEDEIEDFEGKVVYVCHRGKTFVDVAERSVKNQ